MEHPLVLIVDDDPFFRKFCADALEKEGFEVVTAESGADVVRLCAQAPVVLVVVDIYLPEVSGIQILEAIKSQRPSVDVVVTTGYASVETAVQALKKGASDYLRKPFSQEELAASAKNIIAQRKLFQDDTELRHQLRLYELSRSFAAVEEPVRVGLLGLDALHEITGAEAGCFAMLAEQSEVLDVPVRRGVELPSKRAEAQRLLELWKAEVLPGEACVHVATAAETARWFGALLPPGFAHALVSPLKLDDTSAGFFVLLRGAAKGPFDERELRGAEFLCGQLSIAYKAATRFQAAKGLAYVDSLTDLYNARYLPLILEKRIAEARQQRKPLSLLFLDLDNFREVNNRYGHQAGGKCLVEVAWILEGIVRAGDSVIRYGGDEFTIVLPNADTAAAREIAERIRKTIRDHHFLSREQKTVRQTASIGVATYPQDAKTPEMLLHLADQAMYRGKETTRDVVYTAQGGRVE